jgi:hypothetical protein
MATKAPRQNIAGPDYQSDPHGWALHQARLLRAGQVSEIDLENIAEEIESVGRAEFRSLKSNLAQILLHLLKWTYQPSMRSRSWAVSINTHRRAYKSDLEENPSLKARLQDALEWAYKDARAAAADETGLPLKSFPSVCPYDWAEIVDQPIEWNGL